MGDLKLTQVPTLTDFDYMLLVKGNQVAKMEKATLATVVAELLPFLRSNKIINAIAGSRMYRIARLASWQRASFVASIGSYDGVETDLISISSCLASNTPNVSYKRVGTVDLGIKILYDVDANNFLNVYIKSTRPSELDLHCIIGMSSQTITSMGTVTDVSAYTEVATL